MKQNRCHWGYKVNQCPEEKRGNLSIATGRSGRTKINKPHIFITWVKNNTEKRTKWSTEPSGF